MDDKKQEQEISNNTEIMLVLSIQKINLILDILCKQPYIQVIDIIETIQQQSNNQLKKIENKGVENGTTKRP